MAKIAEGRENLEHRESREDTITFTWTESVKQTAFNFSSWANREREGGRR